MSSLRIIAVALLFTLFFAGSSFCADTGPSKPKAAEPAKVKLEMTAADKIVRINKDLSAFKEILGIVPGLAKESDVVGNTYYTYQGKKLEDLDKETLNKLYSAVATQAVRLRTERLNKQLENIRRANELTRQNTQVAPRVNIVTPPYQPPAFTPPPAVNQPPKQPTPPPTPPTLPRR